MYKFDTTGLAVKWNLLGEIPQPFVIINDDIIPIMGLEAGPMLLGLDRFVKGLAMEYDADTIVEIKNRLTEVSAAASIF